MSQVYPEIEALLTDFLNGTRTPLMQDLKGDMTCVVCQEPYMSGEAPEVPIRLKCGHIVGQVCILQWAKPLSDSSRKNTCPLCRQPVFNPGMMAGTPLMSLADESRGSEGQHSEAGVTEAAHSLVEREATPGEEAVDNDHIRRVRANGIEALRRKHLWLQFCEGVVKAVENSNDPLTPMRAVLGYKVLQWWYYMQDGQLPCPLGDQIIRTFQNLHSEFLCKLQSLEPMSNINIDAMLDLEQRLGPEESATDVHRIEFAGRLRECLTRSAVAAGYKLAREEEAERRVRH